LLDHARELADLGFQTLQAKHHVRTAGLPGARYRLRIALAGHALAAPEDAVEQVE
jgi:hypothetical protein